MVYAQNIKLSKFFQVLISSIKDGKKNYLVLFVGSAIAAVISGALSQSGAQGILGTLFDTLWLAGVILISQVILKNQKPPAVSQFFLSFTNTIVLKKMVPAICGALAYGLAIIVIMAPVMGIMSFFMKPDISSNDMQIQMIGFTTGINIFLLFCSLFLTIPLTIFTILNLLKNMPWLLSVKSSYKGCMKNLGLMFFIALAYSLPFMIISTLPMLALFPPTRELFAWLGSIVGGPFEKAMAPILTGVIKLAFISIAPFFMTFFYRLYLAMFVSDQTDIDLESAYDSLPATEHSNT